MMSDIVNAMTVDVEDYFQVSAFENNFDRQSWSSISTRVEENIERILDLFESNNMSATFFMLGWIAERHPDLVKTITKAGHEIASHGYAHIRVTQQNADEFREDITKTKRILEDGGGKEVVGYRAASFSINSQNHWAHRELESAGYKYSSSVYPVVHDHYGVPDAPLSPYNPTGSKFIEVPITAMDFMGRRIPCGGGGYFRLFPYALSSWLIQQINSHEERACIFYFHPWEIDVDQPRLTNINLKTRFRHYNGIARMESKLRKLISSYNWGRMDHIFLS